MFVPVSSIQTFGATLFLVYWDNFYEDNQHYLPRQQGVSTSKQRSLSHQAVVHLDYMGCVEVDKISFVLIRESIL